MPHQDDDMQRRREKRDAQRKRQAAMRRKMRLLIALAVVLLIGCGVGIWFLTKNAGIWGVSVASPEVPETTKATEPEKATSPLAKDPITKIHIRAAGDLNVTDSVIQAGKSVGGYDYSRVFKDVAATLADADLTVMNFEGNVCGEPYGTATTSAPQELLNGLRGAGVDLLQTANSCVINNGLIGLSSTLQAIRAAGIEPVGTFASPEEFRKSKGYTITDVQGIKIAFVGFTKGIGGRGMPAGSEEQVNLLYEDYATTYQTVNKTGIEAILKNVAAEKPDLTVALVHWGSENNDDISKTQKSIVSLMQKQGVNVILGTHPHTVQQLDYDETAGTLVAYSLGDFFGDADKGGTNYSIILDVEITKDATTGVTKVTDYSYTPIYTVKESECTGYRQGERRVVRIATALQAYNVNYLDKITDDAKTAMEFALTRIEDRLTPVVDTK